MNGVVKHILFADPFFSLVFSTRQKGGHGTSAVSWGVIFNNSSGSSMNHSAGNMFESVAKTESWAKRENYL
jgi:Na+/glutamate symporter